MKVILNIVLFLGGMLYTLHAQDCEVSISGDSILCNADDVTTLTATPGFEYYYWGNGEEGMSLETGWGSYRLYAIKEDGCLAYGQFSVSRPRVSDFKGGIRVENNLILDAYYYADGNFVDEFSYTWILEGDTVSYDSFVEIDTVGSISDTFTLQVIYERLCTGEIEEDVIQILGFDQSLANDTIYICANAPQAIFCDLPIRKSGAYGVRRITDFGSDVSCYAQYEFLEDSCTMYNYDTAVWCFKPFWYDYTNYQRYITDIGTHTFRNYQSDTLNILYLEVILGSPPNYSVDTLEFCEDDYFMYNGHYYLGAPALELRFHDTEEECDSIVFERVFLVDSPIATTYIDTAICINDTLIWQGEPYQAGTYEWSYPLNFGCDSTVVLTVESLDLSTISKARTLCEGDTIEVDGNFYTEAGDFTYQKEATLGCDTIVSLSIQLNPPIDVLDEFIIPATGAGTGAIFVNISGGTPPYQLFWSNGSTHQNILGLNAGEYQLDIIDDNGCTASFTFQVPLNTSVDSHQEQLIKVFPNPFSNNLWIIPSDNWVNSNLELEVFNTLGSLVLQRTEIRGKTTLNLDKLSSGIYHYILKSDIGIHISNGALIKH